MGGSPLPFVTIVPWVHSIHPDVIYGWAGSVAAIPRGFSLCDGTNGTPDLQDRFIVGAGSGFNISDVGGAVQISHDFTSATHRHDFPGGFEMDGGDDYQAIDTEAVQVTGTTNTADTRPTFYALCFLKETGL